MSETRITKLTSTFEEWSNKEDADIIEMLKASPLSEAARYIVALAGAEQPSEEVLHNLKGLMLLAKSEGEEMANGNMPICYYMDLTAYYCGVKELNEAQKENLERIYRACYAIGKDSKCLA